MATRRNLAAALAVALLGACGAPQPDGLSGVVGHVWIGPMCPVAVAGTECPDQPYQVAMDVLDEDGESVAMVESDARGHYRVALAPGEYTLSPRSPSSGLPFAEAVPFMVSQGEWTVVDVHYDSGIR